MRRPWLITRRMHSAALSAHGVWCCHLLFCGDGRRNFPRPPATRRSLGADASQNHGVRHPQMRAAIRRGLCPRSRLFGACDTGSTAPRSTRPSRGPDDRTGSSRASPTSPHQRGPRQLQADGGSSASQTRSYSSATCGQIRRRPSSTEASPSAQSPRSTKSWGMVRPEASRRPAGSGNRSPTLPATRHHDSGSSPIAENVAS